MRCGWQILPPGGRGREQDRRVKKLCRLLGFGLLVVTASNKVEVVVEPVPWRPRRDARRRSAIVTEHRRRQGDPAVGGSTRRPIMTAYRQQALACAAALARTPARPRDLKPAMPDAPKILLRNVYGWFTRVVSMPCPIQGVQSWRNGRQPYPRKCSDPASNAQAFST